MWITLLAAGIFFVFLGVIFLLAGVYIKNMWKVATFVARYVTKKFTPAQGGQASGSASDGKAPESKSKKETRIESPKETIVSEIIEENKKRWLEQKAATEARWKELESRPDAKILHFPRKL